MIYLTLNMHTSASQMNGIWFHAGVKACMHACMHACCVRADAGGQAGRQAYCLCACTGIQVYMHTGIAAHGPRIIDVLSLRAR